MQDHRAFVGRERLKFGGEQVELAGARERNRVIGKGAHGHIFHSFFQTCGSGCILDVHGFRIAGKAITQPPVILACGTYRDAPPLMGDGVGEQSIVGFLGDRRAGQADNFRRPSVRKRVTGNLHDVQFLRRGQPVERQEVSEFLNGCSRVRRGQVLMRRLEKDVEIHARVVAFVLLKHSSNDGSRKARLVGDKSESLRRKHAGVRLVRSRMVRCREFAATDDEHVRGQSNVNRRGEAIDAKTADRKPSSGIEQVGRVVADVGEAEAGNRAIIRILNAAFVFEGQGGRCVLG